MIDHAAHFEQVVKDELAKACQKLGIDNKQAGFAIGGFGSSGIVVDNNSGETMVIPMWSVTLSLRNLLLGLPPTSANLPVPGVLPQDEHFRATVSVLLPQIESKRQAEFRGEE